MSKSQWRRTSRGRPEERPCTNAQQTAAGEHEVKKALRRSLLKYQLHQDVDLFERAYGYVKQYC